MKTFILFLFIGFNFSGCVSLSKYNLLKIQKEKALGKTGKLDEKLKNLQIYQKHLKDSINHSF
ncbi:MAG: hypothetical protein ACKVQB_13660 [Bacteroidia bacterium]